MLSRERARRIETNDSPPDNQIEALGATNQAHLDVTHAGNCQFLLIQIEPRQRHDDSTRAAAGASDTTKKAFDRLIEMLFDVLPGRLRSALRELSVPEAVDDTGDRIPSPFLNDECVAILG